MSFLFRRLFWTNISIPSRLSAIYRFQSGIDTFTPTNSLHSDQRETKRKKGKTRSITSGYERVPPEQKDDDIVTSEILTAALNHVNTRGWNEDAIKAGAKDVFMAEEISGMFQEYDLVKFFFSACNKDLENHLSTSQPTPTVFEALEFRLEKVVLYVPKLQEALALATKPENVSMSFQLLLQLADSIVHHSMKDKSTDINWYTKRMGIASIYVASELCLVQDTSENQKETFEFLERRVKDFDNLGSCFISPGLPLPDVMSAGFTTLRNILGNNSRR